MSRSAFSTGIGSAQPVKDDDWRVAHLVDVIWREHFAEVPRVNQIIAGYDYPWKWRLGRIRMSLDQRFSEITLNGLLDHPDVPIEVVTAILAHEIVHYAQGFGSPLPRPQRHAHAHGCVSHELADRGLGRHERALYDWGDTIWPEFRVRARAERHREPALVWTPCTTTVKMVY